jgi:hypothetical protein
MHTCGNTLEGAFLFPRDPVGNAPIRSLLLYGHFPKCIRHSLLNSLWACPTESPIPFRYCFNGLQELLGTFPNVSQNRFGHFLNNSLKAACFCVLRLKIKEAGEKGSSPNFYLSNHTTHSQTQTGAIVHLKGQSSEIIILFIGLYG